mmetsp:Transcript_16713/g.33404  ORF Transcript_16713/g.33404 Transcript_16713/m.33404 type:complete len:222 (-) Transcript_16713:416-1081(-)
MASLVIVQKKKENQRRQKIAEMKRDHKKFVDEVLSRWGESGNGELDFEELRNWLTSISGVRASDDETKWVMAMANKGRKENGLTFAEMERKTVLPDDFEKALDAWMSYRDAIPEIDKVFQKFDPNNDHILDREELMKLLTDLNQGEQPEESEVDFVLKEADVIGQGSISKPCLAKAVSIWYTRVPDETSNTGTEQVGGEPLPGQTSVSGGLGCGSKFCRIQ